MLTAQGRVIYANPRLEGILGLPRGLLVGRDFHALYRDPADRATLDFLLNARVEAEDTQFHLPLPSGSRLPVLLATSELPEGGMLVQFTDITAMKEAEASAREHLAYVSQLSDTALEQAIALKHQTSTAQAEAASLRDQAQELTTVNKELERRVLQRTAELRQANVDAIYMLAIASEAKDHDTGAHVRRIRGLAEKTARALGYDPNRAYDTGLAAVLHDVGKIHVPDAILTKPGPLDPDERKTMEQHTLWGQRILPDRPFFQRARAIARSHHEHFDGSGYPDQLSGRKIPEEARIVHVADVYDALTSERPYKEAWAKERALADISEHVGTHFDPEIVEALNAALADSEAVGAKN